MTRRNLISRRRLLGAGSASAAALVLPSCVDSSTSGQALIASLPDTNRLRVLNWADYIDPSEGDVIGTVGTATRLLNASVIYEPLWEDNVSGWDTFVEPQMTGADVDRFDIITPTFTVARRMIDRGWAEPLPLELIPNHANIDPAYLSVPWDRGARYQMPWQAGITGIAYNPAETGRPINSIQDLLDPEFAGRVGFIGEMSEAVGMMMLAAGEDPSRPTAATAGAALDTIEAAVASGQIGAFTFNEFTDALADGTLAIAMAWSGDTVQLRLDRPDIEFVIPDEGAIRWFDTMVMPTNAPNQHNAAEWMNLVYDPVIAAQITSWVQYISPVIGVRDALDDLGGESAQLAENPILFPDAEVTQRLFTWGGDEELDIELENRFYGFAE